MRDDWKGRAPRETQAKHMDIRRTFFCSANPRWANWPPTPVHHSRSAQGAYGLALRSAHISASLARVSRRRARQPVEAQHLAWRIAAELFPRSRPWRRSIDRSVGDLLLTSCRSAGRSSRRRYDVCATPPTTDEEGGSAATPRSRPGAMWRRQNLIKWLSPRNRRPSIPAGGLWPLRNRPSRSAGPPRRGVAARPPAATSRRPSAPRASKWAANASMRPRTSSRPNCERPLPELSGVHGPVADVGCGNGPIPLKFAPAVTPAYVAPPRERRPDPCAASSPTP